MDRNKLRLPGDTDRVEQLQYVTLDDGPVGSSFIGDGSGGKATSITNSVDNTFVGSKSGGIMTSGTDNVLIGTDAGGNAESLYDVVGIGKSAVRDALDCARIVAIGTDAGKHLQNSKEYVTVGHSSGTGTKATHSVALGTYAGHLASNIDGVCFVGHKAGQNTSSSFRTVAVGSGSLERSGDITDSVIIGSKSGLQIQSIANVVAIGSGVMANVSCQGTEFNTVVGAQAAYEMCGDENTIMGYAAASNVHGDQMTIIGARTAQDIDGNASVIVGANLCNEPEIVSNCTIIGHEIKPNVDPSQYDTVQYNNSVFIGNNLRIEPNEFENSLVIGVGPKRFLQAKGNNDVLGNFTGTFSNVVITGPGDMQVLADAIFKENLIVQTDVGPANINRFLENIISQKQIFVKTNGIDTTDFTGHTFEDAFGSIKYACSHANPGDIIVVEAGTYEEDTPITVPPDVSIVGQDLRSTIVDPINKQKHVFHVQQGVYITGIRVINLRRPAFTICFPCSQVDSEIHNGELIQVVPIHSLSGYTTPPEIFVEAPSSPGGVQASVSCSINVNGTITSYTIDEPGSGYTRRPHISIPPPQKLFLTKSPYIQNVTMITQGLYTNGGTLLRNDKELREDYTYPLDLVQMDIDQEGGGGGCLVDGYCVQDESPIRSILAATFTVLSHGGIGHFCTNQGFAQLVSTYTHFASIGFLTTSGGEMSISNSVSDFGLDGLVAEGYWPTSISTLTVTSIDETDGIVTSITGTYTGRKPDIGAAFYLEKWHYIRSSELISGQEVKLGVYPYFPDTEITLEQEIDIYVPSKIYTASILFEFCGSGISYNALPTFSGTPDPEKEINQVAPGVCYYTSSDHLGNLKVGPQFYVNQLTGEVTLSGSVAVTSITRLGPFKRNEIEQGVAIQEFSARTDLTDSTLQSTDDSVSTSLAVKTYVDDSSKDIKDYIDVRVTPGGETHNILHKVSDADWDTAWSDTLYANISCSNANIDNIHANALEVDGNVVITEGNLVLNSVLISEFSKDTTLQGTHDSISTTKAVKDYVDVRVTPGGETHNILHKLSDADWDIAWSDTLYANVSCSNANVNNINANALEVEGNVVITEGNLILNEVLIQEISKDNTLQGSHNTISTTKAVKDYVDVRVTPGGETHNILHKLSDADWDTAWSDTLYANVSCSNANIDNIHANALEVEGNVVITEGNLMLNEVVISEFSKDNTLQGSHNTISTTKAVKDYVDVRVTPGGETHNILHKLSDADWDIAWSDTLYANVSCSNANVNNINANALEVDGNVIVTDKLTVHGNISMSGETSKFVVMNEVDGGNKGISLWSETNTDWGIYMGQSGPDRSFSSGAATGGDGFDSYAMRFRTSAEVDQGIIWENANEHMNMSLRGSDGYLSVRGELASDGVNISKRLKNMVSVIEFGADPSGIHDSTHSIQSAIDNGWSYVVYFPEGKYLLSGPIILRDFVYLMGPDAVSNSSTAATQGGAKLVWNSGSGSACMTTKDSVTPYSFGGISNLTLMTNFIDTYDWIFEFPGMNQCHFFNVTAGQNHGGILKVPYLDSRAAWINFFTNCHWGLPDYTLINDSVGHVIDHVCSDSFFIGCYFSGGLGCIDRSTGGNTYTGCHFDRVLSSDAALTLKRSVPPNGYDHSTQDTKHVTVTGCYFDVNETQGILIDSSGALVDDTYMKVTISTCTFRGRSGNYSSDIGFNADGRRVKGVSVLGCAFSGHTVPFTWDDPSLWSESCFIGNFSSGVDYISTSTNHHSIIDPAFGCTLNRIQKMTCSPTTRPLSPSAGEIYFDSSDNILYCYDGSTWRSLF